MGEVQAWGRKTILLIGILVVTCIGLLIAVIVLAVQSDKICDNVCSASQPPRATITSTSPDVFRDLTKDEIVRVRNHVLNDASLNLTEYSKATEYSNYIFLIEFMNPDKDEALDFLDRRIKQKPKRLARVVLFAGARRPPVVEEMFIPVDDPNSYVRTAGSSKTIPFKYRPDGDKTYGAFQNIANAFTQNISAIMLENFQMNCASRMCALAIPSIPAKEGDRSFWIRLHRPIGSTTYPLPIELYMQSNGDYISDWTVGKVFYNGALFDSVENFTAEYEVGNVAKVSQAAPQEGTLYSDLNRRGNVIPDSMKVEPELYEPGGKRYTAEENHVEYMGWSFDFRMRTSSGVQLFDVRFNNTRIAYELSLQEAVALYGGFGPASLFADYLDSTWGLGKTFELLKGIDCPTTATFLDVVAFVNSGEPTKRRNAVCVFELHTGIALRRHYDNAGGGKYTSYGGTASNVLVLRTIMTPYNYDYIFDYVFYPNGIIEIKVTTSGYIIGTFWMAEEQKFATRVEQYLAAPIHDHMFHYKVDLDIAGRQNSFEMIRSKVQKTARWSQQPGDYHYERYFEREHKKTEDEAVYKYDFQKPAYLNFYNEKANNSHGVRRGYRVQLNGITRQMYPSNWSYTRALQWSYYQVAVTKYKDNETRSSSMYNQQDMHHPVVDFSEFINDNDDITNEDLVTWVTLGVMHLPHAEDIPVTTTPANTAGFFLRPFNYFDEDPSVASRDTVVITPAVDNGPNIERPERDRRSSCVPRDDPISYHGNLEVL